LLACFVFHLLCLLLTDQSVDKILINNKRFVKSYNK